MPPARNIIIGAPVDEVKKTRARELRQIMTPQQALLWEHVRSRRLCGLKFRREQPVEGFLVDLYCHEAGVVVEVDGSVHETQVDYDRERDTILTERGLVVLRFTNDSVEQKLPLVLEQIARVCQERITGNQETSPRS